MTLLSKLQSATEGSRELDGEVYCATRGLQFHMWDGAGIVVRRPEFRHIEAERVKYYTTNLQDAVSLVPEGWSWQLYGPDPLVTSGHTNRYRVGRPYCLLGLPGQAEADGRAPTPALALCIAIIKAIEAKKAEATEPTVPIDAGDLRYW